MLELIAPGAAVIAVSMLLLWLLSLRLENASIVDAFWGLGFVIVAGLTYVRVGQHSGPHAALLAGATAVWGLRLALYLGIRNHGKGEDRRYKKLRRTYTPFSWKSLYIVFGLQGSLIVVVSLPLVLGQVPRPEAGLGWLDGLGLALFLIGLGFEVVADAQLAAFSRESAGTGKVLDRGLWRWSRHPNYFGEVVLWWGLGLIALSTPGAWWGALVGPAVMTFLLVRVSGVPMMEAGMKERRPDYAAYIARTSALIPWPPKTGP